jgi:hypothetical protein
MTTANPILGPTMPCGYCGSMAPAQTENDITTIEHRNPKWCLGPHQAA